MFDMDELTKRHPTTTYIAVSLDDDRATRRRSHVSSQQ